MLKHRALVALATAAVASLPVAAMNFAPITASASSHREAPTIANDPAADNTDVYAFASPDDANNSLPDVPGQLTSPRDAGTVTLVANYIPFQSPNGGPNFYRFADDVLYEIHIDNSGHAADDVVYQLQFNTTTVSDQTFLYNTGKMTWNGAAYANWNRPQTYSVKKVTGGGAPVLLGTNLLTPPVDVGPHSVGTTTDYHNLVGHSVYALANNKGTVFAGQRADPFFVDLGAVFDLLSVVPQGHNYLQGENVNSIVLKIPKSEIGNPNNDHIMGVWATAKRKTTQTVNSDGSRTSAGAEVQVSRLGNPLVNEVVIPLGLKDAFNGLAPALDGTVPGAVSAVKTPELPKLFRALGIDANAPLTNRGDLFATFLQGLDGLNQPKPPRLPQVPGEMLRLNYDIAPSTNNPNTVNRLAALAGQLDGFPNGRRLADDVTDIELSAADGILCDPTRSAGLPATFRAQFIADGQVGPTCRSTDAPILGDGVNATDQPFQTTFPYLADPYQGHN